MEFESKSTFTCTCTCRTCNSSQTLGTQFLYSVQQQKIHSINTELENYKKSIMKEQEHNEQLTLLLNKIETDINYVIKQIELSTAKKEALHTEYMTYTRTLQETEQTLTVASGVSSYIGVYVGTNWERRD